MYPVMQMQSLAIHPFARRLLACCEALSKHNLVIGGNNTVSALDDGLLWLTSMGADFGTMTSHHLIVQWPDSDRHIMAASDAQPHRDCDSHQHYLLDSQSDASLIARLWMPFLQHWAKGLPDGASFSMPTGSPAHASVTLIISHSQTSAVSNILSLMNTDTVIVQPEQGVWLTTALPEDLQSLVSTLHGWVLVQ